MTFTTDMKAELAKPLTAHTSSRRRLASMATTSKAGASLTKPTGYSALMGGRGKPST